MSAPVRRRMLVVLFGIYIAALACIAFWPTLWTARWPDS